jgi:hypothetical protein
VLRGGNLLLTMSLFAVAIVVVLVGGGLAFFFGSRR